MDQWQTRSVDEHGTIAVRKLRSGGDESLEMGSFKAGLESLSV